jgi:hypothetical protein
LRLAIAGPTTTETPVSPKQPLGAQDIERITRDVFDSLGVPIPSATATATTSGWRLVIIDEAARIATIDLPDGQPADIRGALLREIESWKDSPRLPDDGDVPPTS